MTHSWIQGTSPPPLPRLSPAYACFEQARACLRAGDVRGAIRQLDRAWRTAPYPDIIGPVYGEVLVEHGLIPQAAATVLRRANRDDPRPGTEALLARALLLAGRRDEAGATLGSALRRYGLRPQSALENAARQLSAAGIAPGWVGLAPDLSLVGEVRGAGAAPVKLQVQLESGGRLHQQNLRPAADDRARFQLPAKKLHAGRLQVLADGAPLLGSGLPWPPPFALDGRSTTGKHGKVEGWARLGWDPEVPLKLFIRDAQDKRVPLKSGHGKRARQYFEIAPQRAGLRGDRLEVLAQLPTGEYAPLPDSPLLLRSVIPPPPKKVPAPATKPKPRGVDLIVPVYDGLEETLACLESVLASKHAWQELIVIDDCSPNPALSAALRQRARRARFTLLVNPANLGFSGTVNRGLALHPERDAVVLNSDTLVHGDWLRRLRAAAYREPRIGSATPLSNDGSVASYPRYLARELDAAQAQNLDRLAARVNKEQSSPLPVGVGFCLYLRRDCLNEAGDLDGATFGRGYGEETDLCLRAARRGWQHVLAADVFVLHAGGTSFGTRRAALQERAQRLLKLRHPDFAKLVARFDAEDPGRVLRRNLAAAQLRQQKKKIALLVSLARPGGVGRMVDERRALLQAQGYAVAELKPLSEETRDFVLGWDDAAIEPLKFRREEATALAALLGKLPIAHSEIHHFLGLDAAVIDAVRGLRAPYDVYVHDYAWFCPQITLIDHSGRYCGEPALSACERCLRKNGSNLGEAISVAALVKRSGGWLKGARRIIAPSADTADRLRRHFPGIKLMVTPWQPDPPRAVPPPRQPDKRLRVALLGAIGDHKGYQQLLACARDAARRELPLEFIVVGYTQDDRPLLKTGRVFVTGHYFEVEAQNLLRREAVDVILLPSVWPETWSYTLTHALASGLPIVSFDIGAIAQRLRGLNKGLLLPLDTAPAELNDRLLKFGGNESESLAAAYSRVLARSLSVA